MWFLFAVTTLIAPKAGTARMQPVLMIAEIFKRRGFTSTQADAALCIVGRCSRCCSACLELCLSYYSFLGSKPASSGPLFISRPLLLFEL